ncbi:rod shape-determining protein MreD [Bacillaceae bacterium SIJ1]|uniref:rod shape-determining protein MreD n=1 Tax=Litoribacterium kuwaitense TaxID=1398745 RepID=UPI0013EBCFF2|nr:rod shape-determining protein MreD [Litoribacterium kuwaitense]NGP45487.1 rod shape-determining protein MreD [Litoribacterium kuwaitense]
MYKFLLAFVVLILFMMESTVTEWLPGAFGEQDWLVIPHFSLVAVFLLAFKQGRSLGILYGISMGLLYDVYYTGLIGIYAFSYTLMAYMIGVWSKYFQDTLIVALIVCTAGIAAVEWITYGVLLFIGFTSDPLQAFAYVRLLPTLVFNAIFCIILYKPFEYLIAKAEFADPIKN